MTLLLTVIPVEIGLELSFTVWERFGEGDGDGERLGEGEESGDGEAMGNASARKAIGGGCSMLAFAVACELLCCFGRVRA